MFVDTTVFVDYLRNYPQAEAFLKKNIKSMDISVIVELELIDGFEKKADIKKINKLFQLFGVETVHISEDVSGLAETIYKNYRHSNGISVNDSLIAATAIYYEKPLATHNKKHFEFIPDLKLISPY